MNVADIHTAACTRIKARRQISTQDRLYLWRSDKSRVVVERVLHHWIVPQFLWKHLEFLGLGFEAEVKRNGKWKLNRSKRTKLQKKRRK
jgi:hypothetical protein